MIADEKIRQSKNEYPRRWRAANKDKVRASNERYWVRRAEREAAQQAAENAEGEEVQNRG